MTDQSKRECAMAVQEIIAELVESEIKRVAEEAEGLRRRDGGRSLCVIGASTRITRLVLKAAEESK